MLKSEVIRKAELHICYCDICGNSIGAEDRSNKNFEYSKTKRGEIWVHTSCWNKLYGR